MKIIAFPRAALLCAALSFLLIPADAAPTVKPTLLQTLLARHRAAMGAGKVTRPDPSAVEVIYTLSAGGLAGTLTTYEAPPHRSREEIALGPILTVTGNDGKTAWEQDSSGNVRIIGGEELAENKADSSLSIENYDPFRNGMAGKVTLHPERESGTGDYIIDVQAVGGTLQTIYLDPKTYLISKFIERKGGVAGTISILAYKTLEGAKIPAEMQIGYGGLPLTIAAHLQSAVKLTTVANSLFAIPKQATDWKFLDPAAVSQVTIPFTNDDNEIVVPVTINGHALKFLLDSGAGSSFITGEAAQAAGLTAQGDVPALGYGGSAQTGITTQTTLDIPGAVELGHQQLHVIKDERITKLLSARGNVDGAIGYDLFSRFVVQIDYSAKTLTLSDPQTFPAAPTDAQMILLPIKLESRQPKVMASVDGKPAGRFLVDTGDSGGVHLYSGYAQANGLLPDPKDPKAISHTGMGIGGAVTETSTPGHTLTLANYRLAGLWISTMTAQGITSVSDEAGGIGNLALSQFAVTFDYPHSQIRLIPRPGIPSEPPGPLVPPPPTSPASPAPGATPATTQTLPSLFRAALLSDCALDLDDLMLKHLEALGGREAVAAIKSTRVASDVTTGGIQGTVTTVYAAPDNEFEEDKLGILDIVQGYDGKDAWQRDTNGNVRPLAADELKLLRTQLFFDTNSYVLPGRIAGTLSLRPDPDPATGDFVVDALPAGGKPSTLFLDPQTFLIVREQHLDDDVLVTTAFSDYRMVDGVAFPFKQITTNGKSRYDVVSTTTKIENNVTVPQALFEPPVGGGHFQFVKPGAVSATVPFDMDDGEIGFSASINGHPTRLFLDSGASGIALTQQAAEQLHLKTAGFMEARGYGGSTDMHPILISSLEVPGAVRLTQMAAISIALPASLNSYLSRPVSGFVGYDLLAHFVVRIDFLHHRLTFINPTSFLPSRGDGTALPADLDNEVPSVTGQLDGLPPGRYLVDTGDEAALRLYEPYIAQYHLGEKYPRGIPVTGGGIGGASRSRLTRIARFTVAGVIFKDVPTDFSLDSEGGASQVNAGALGSTLLSRFVVTFDYPHNRIFFAPNAQTAKPFDTQTTGLTLVQIPDSSSHSHLVVAEIQTGAPAASNGLNAYDEVLAIDGRPALSLGLIAARNLLGPDSGKRSHTLLVRSSIGKPRPVAVPVYDPLPPR